MVLKPTNLIPIGIPVCVNKKLEIFVQELESQKLVERISNDLTAWHENRTKNPTKFWRSGDICAALRNSDGKYHRAKVQRLIQKQRKCIVNNKKILLRNKQTHAQCRKLRLAIVFIFIFDRFSSWILDAQNWLLLSTYPDIRNS